MPRCLLAPISIGSATVALTYVQEMKSENASLAPVVPVLELLEAPVTPVAPVASGNSSRRGKKRYSSAYDPALVKSMYISV